VRQFAEVAAAAEEVQPPAGDRKTKVVIVGGGAGCHRRRRRPLAGAGQASCMRGREHPQRDTAFFANTKLSGALTPNIKVMRVRPQARLAGAGDLVRIRADD